MLQSSLFTKTRREDPKDEVSKNARLLIRAGFINKELAGVYSYLPLGLRVLNKINDIIRDEMNKLGGQEVSLTALQNPEIWKKTDRYDTDVAFRTELKVGGELTLGWTHEEAVTNIMKGQISSYKDLPRGVYQIQTKFRNEERAKSGILRGREFLMKDFYSFHRDQTDLDSFYEKMKDAYRAVFRRVGIGDDTFVTFASGGAFSKYSHEFQTLCETGEDTVYVSRQKNLAINSEVYNDEVLADLGVAKDELEEQKAIEVGNIFKLGTRFSEPLEVSYTDESGNKQPVIMGCYGIGPGRVMGTVVEKLADEKGLVWPPEIAPFQVHIVALNYDKDEAVKTAADNLYNDLKKEGWEVLLDDRGAPAGEKFGDSDLYGISHRVVVSGKTLEAGKWEVVARQGGEVRQLATAELKKFLTEKNAR